MKKNASLFLAAFLTFACITPTFAADVPSMENTGISPRYIVTDSADVYLDFNGNQIYCEVVISAKEMATPIRGTLRLTSGSYSQQWPISGTGDVDITKTVTRSQGGTYVLTFSGTCGSDPINKQTSGTK